MRHVNDIGSCRQGDRTTTLINIRLAAKRTCLVRVLVCSLTCVRRARVHQGEDADEGLLERGGQASDAHSGSGSSGGGGSGWELFHDGASGYDYYYNASTGESMWDHDFDGDGGGDEGSVVGFGASGGGRSTAAVSSVLRASMGPATSTAAVATPRRPWNDHEDPLDSYGGDDDDTFGDRVWSLAVRDRG